MLSVSIFLSSMERLKKKTRSGGGPQSNPNIGNVGNVPQRGEEPELKSLDLSQGFSI